MTELRCPIMADVEQSEIMKVESPMTEAIGHECWGGSDLNGWCEERDGEFTAGCGGYAFRVNFCPFCGARAPKQIRMQDND